MDPIEKALDNLDRAVEKVDKKAAAKAKPGEDIRSRPFRQILHRGPDNRVTHVDTVPLTAEMIAERAVLEHYRTEHPTLLARVSAGALNGKLVGAPEPMVSRIDLEDGDDD